MRVIVASSGVGHINRGYETWAEQLAYALRNKVRVYLFKGGGKIKSNIEYVLPCVKRNSFVLGGRHSLRPYARRVQIEEATFQYPLTLLAKILDIDIIHTPQFFPLLFRVKRRKWINSEIVWANLALWLPYTIRNISYIYIQQPAPYHVKKARELGVNTKNWFMIPLFVDAHKFSPVVRTRLREKLGIPEDAFVILSVASITKRYKRVDWLIKEVAKLKNPSKGKIFLIVAGETEDETEEVIALGKKLLRDRIVFLSNLPHEKMPEVYASSDLFVLASCPEFFGLGFLEAMASGKPAIGHNFPVTRWIIGDGGDTVDIRKEGELAKAIKRYVIDEDLRTEKGRRARQRVEKTFSLDKVIKQILHMYNVILQGN